MRKSTNERIVVPVDAEAGHKCVLAAHLLAVFGVTRKYDHVVEPIDNHRWHRDVRRRDVWNILYSTVSEKNIVPFSRPKRKPKPSITTRPLRNVL